MPVQSWTSGQTLTAAELTSVTNMLPYPATAGSNVSPCVAGTYYFCTATVTMTMPAPSPGTTIGFRCAGGGGVTISNHSSELFFSPYLQAASATSFTLAAIGQYVVFISDGTNWYEIASGGLAGKGLISYVATTGGTITSTASPGAGILGAGANVTVQANRVLRIRFTGSMLSSASTLVEVNIMKGPVQLRANAQSAIAAGYVNTTIETIDIPGAGTWAYSSNAWSGSANTISPIYGSFTVEDVT
jgi:hypothetical protein